MLIANLLNPKLDYVFKRLFGHAGNEDITKKLLSCITNEKYSKIELDCNPILEKDLLDDKIGILDIKAILDDNTSCDIEMQVVDHKNIVKRMLFYWSKLYYSSIKSGDKYSDLKRTIVILFSNFNLDVLKDIKKYYTKWQIREDENTQIVLTDDFVFYIIEIDKIANTTNHTELDDWVNFINNPEETIDMENKELKKAKDELEKISQDERERYLADLREKYIRDQLEIEETGYAKGLQAGIEQGIKQGIEQGIERGIEQNKIETAKVLLSKGLSVEEIFEITGLSKKQIEKLMSEQK